MAEEEASLLWTHPNPESTPMWEFKTKIEKKYSQSFKDYEAFRQWSIDNLDEFWSEVWHFTGVVASAPFTKALTSTTTLFPRPTFFPDARLNFAENLLYPPSNPPPDSPALLTATESTRGTISWSELRRRAASLTRALQARGIKPHDRVAGYLGNHAGAVVGMLAATALGAIWTGVSPDTGVTAVLDRLVQIRPKVLLVDNAVEYNGKKHETRAKVGEIVEGLKEGLEWVVGLKSVEGIEFDMAGLDVSGAKAVLYDDFVKDGAEGSQNTDGDGQRQFFAQLPADHPVYILYSSGTTGKPKCIVHGAIGTLIQHKKEHAIHSGIGPGSRFFYFTTVTWMMWHWLISGLASGATLVLYDGSPFRPLDSAGANGELAMPRLIAELSITHFGNSAKYLSVMEQKDAMPLRDHGIATPSLQAVYSTGSPLAPSTFRYVYRAFGASSSINLGSITGGTDIVSLFGAPNPLVPVYAGEIQARGLGMAVETWDYSGADVTASGEPGDLVCVKPFPCQPVGFWGDDDKGSKYKASYFETYPSGVWHHGDFIRFNPATGPGMVMLGRSDGVLKPSGVRFGSAEIYNVLLKHFSAEVEDALCIGRRREQDSDESVILFLKMAEGEEFEEGLAKRIKDTVRKELSARHVPAVIDRCPEIPVTTNGKKVEIAVKQLLSGINVKTSASVANKECLEWYKKWGEEH